MVYCSGSKKKKKNRVSFVFKRLYIFPLFDVDRKSQNSGGSLAKWQKKLPVKEETCIHYTQD